MEQELRAYFWCNMYLQGIHAGIQAQHCTADMFVTYNPNIVGRSKQYYDKTYLLYEWAEYHKTTILLNGGYADNLNRIRNMLSYNSPFPWSTFSESREALNGCITCVGIILPERIYNCPEDKIDDLPIIESQIAQEVQQCHLMR